ncbi:hypothetical protein TcBrA4_0134940 [Trypanosoma cruzi]|nr:hypothetical protein TcBrA4_0134940 [Trypanosoma cruzi]
MSSIPDELFGRWLLTTFNGLDLSDQGYQPCSMSLEPSGDRVEIFIEIVNIMSGTLEYRDGTLTGPLISTMIAGEGLLEGIEEAFAAGIEAGMEVLIEEATMTFSQGGNTFFFVAQPDSAQQ